MKTDILMALTGLFITGMSAVNISNARLKKDAGEVHPLSAMAGKQVIMNCSFPKDTFNINCGYEINHKVTDATLQIPESGSYTVIYNIVINVKDNKYAACSSDMGVNIFVNGSQITNDYFRLPGAVFQDTLHVRRKLMLKKNDIIDLRVNTNVFFWQLFPQPEKINYLQVYKN